ncbi:hypothetical protein [Gordonia sp. FQ]|uniref:hypothetical protein n=1 Tax=Gordonia sp. FQ TaxID=3446634 RepID=UPI003F8414CC
MKPAGIESAETTAAPALGGFFRVLVFIVVGLVLLGLGVVYAQSLPEDDPAADCPTGPIPVLHGR